MALSVEQMREWGIPLVAPIGSASANSDVDYSKLSKGDIRISPAEADESRHVFNEEVSKLKHYLERLSVVLATQPSAETQAEHVRLLHHISAVNLDPSIKMAVAARYPQHVRNEVQKTTTQNKNGIHSNSSAAHQAAVMDVAARMTSYYHTQHMQAVQSAFAEFDARSKAAYDKFRNSPFTEESRQEFLAEIDACCRKRDQITDDLIAEGKDFHKLSPEEQKKHLHELKEHERYHLEQKRIKEEEIRRLEEQAAQETDPIEKAKLRTLATAKKHEVKHHGKDAKRTGAEFEKLNSEYKYNGQSKKQAEHLRKLEEHERYHLEQKRSKEEEIRRLEEQAAQETDPFEKARLQTLATAKKHEVKHHGKDAKRTGAEFEKLNSEYKYNKQPETQAEHSRKLEEESRRLEEQAAQETDPNKKARLQTLATAKKHEVKHHGKDAKRTGAEFEKLNSEYKYNEQPETQTEHSRKLGEESRRLEEQAAQETDPFEKARLQTLAKAKNAGKASDERGRLSTSAHKPIRPQNASPTEEKRLADKRQAEENMTYWRTLYDHADTDAKKNEYAGQLRRAHQEYTSLKFGRTSTYTSHVSTGITARSTSPKTNPLDSMSIAATVEAPVPPIMSTNPQGQMAHHRLSSNDGSSTQGLGTLAHPNNLDVPLNAEQPTSNTALAHSDTTVEKSPKPRGLGSLNGLAQARSFSAENEAQMDTPASQPSSGLMGTLAKVSKQGADTQQPEPREFDFAHLPIGSAQSMA